MNEHVIMRLQYRYYQGLTIVSPIIDSLSFHAEIHSLRGYYDLHHDHDVAYPNLRWNFWYLTVYGKR